MCSKYPRSVAGGVVHVSNNSNALSLSKNQFHAAGRVFATKRAGTCASRRRSAQDCVVDEACAADVDGDQNDVPGFG